MPSAKIEALENAPPEKMFSRPSSPLPLTWLCRSVRASVQVGQISRSLQQQHDNRQVARPLVDLATAALSLLLQFLEVGNHDAQQLDHDRGRNVGHDAEREDRGVGERSSGEDVQQAEQSVAADLALQVREGFRVDPRDHDKTTEAIDKNQGERKENTLAQLLDLEYVLDGFD